MLMVSVAQKLNTIEEQHHDQSCLFQQGNYGNKGHNPEKSVLGLSPNEDLFFSSETTHDRRTVSKPKLIVSAWRLQEQRKQP
jgi:hypothetical protein